MVLTSNSTGDIRALLWLNTIHRAVLGALCMYFLCIYLNSQKTGAFSLIWEEFSNCADVFPNKRKCPFPPQPLWLTVWPVFVVEVHMYSLVLTHGLSSIHIFLTYLRKCLKLACMIIGLHKQQNTSGLAWSQNLIY